MQSAFIRGLSFAGLLSLLSASGAARADCQPLTIARTGQSFSPCVDADNLWPHAGGGPYFVIGSTATTPRGSLAFGLVGSFLSEPLGLDVASPDPAGSTVFSIDKAFDATVLLALGMTDRLELTLAAPATLYQSGAGLQTVSATNPALLRSAPRDMRFGFSLAMLTRPPAAERGPALTGRLEFSTPTGSAAALSRGRTAVVAPSLAFSYRIGRVDVAAEALARLRGEVTFADTVVGPQVGGAVGASVDILKDRWLGAGAELFALYTTSKQLPGPATAGGATPPPLVPGEWIAHVSTAHFLAGDLTLSLGGGSSVPFASRGAPTAPQYRLDFAIRYAPQGMKSPR